MPPTTRSELGRWLIPASLLVVVAGVASGLIRWPAVLALAPSVCEIGVAG